MTENKKAKILIVDDNPANLHLASINIKKMGYEIITSGDGKNALEMIEIENPDLILLDIMMPGMDGYEVAEKLKSNPQFSETPIIFLTALKHTESLVRGFKAGAVDYITKPFNKEELTARVKNHIDLKLLKDKLKKHLEEKDDLFRVTIHDMKNPIQGILGLTEILQMPDTGLEKSEINGIYDSIDKAAKQSLHILNDLLDSHAVESGEIKIKIEDVNPETMLKEVQKSNIDTANAKNIDIVLESMPESTIVNIDLSKAKRAIDNLISNAIKYSPKKSKVVIKPQILENKLRVSIIDEGPGIKESEHDLVYKKFSKLSNQPTGNETSTGLGLSIVKSFVEAMGGSVGFKSEVGKGSEFYVDFNLA
jgi:two-component system sensor histidine kinase/response regulator